MRLPPSCGNITLLHVQACSKQFLDWYGSYSTGEGSRANQVGLIDWQENISIIKNLNLMEHP